MTLIARIFTDFKKGFIMSLSTDKQAMKKEVTDDH
jgi:hypothetical protein